jgi:hypothetical protein
MIKKLATFFSGATDALEMPNSVQKPSAPENISLLKLCDQKLDKLAKYFSGTQEAPAIMEEPPLAVSPDEGQADAAEMPAVLQESLAPDNMSFLITETLQTDSMEIPVSPQARYAPEVAVQAECRAEAAEPVQALQRDWEEKIATQLQILEQQLGQRDRDVKHAETELSALKGSLQQQLGAFEQRLLDNKNSVEITLKSAFKQIVDRQAAVENKSNQQTDMIQQVLGTTQESITEAGVKLNSLAEQIRLLTENLQQLTKNFEAYKIQADVASLAARLAALEKPPKRKSWFRK